MKEKRLFLDIHAIQTLPPSNVNRDDAGSPKTAQYGGVTRARVSSQAWKKAMRDYFKEHGVQNVGVRTLEVGELVKSKLLELDKTLGEDEALEIAIDVLNKAGFGVDKKKGASKALVFMISKQAENLAKIGLGKENCDKVKDEDLIKMVNKEPSVDLALFGRMVASKTELNIEASCQVAHSISTHAVDDDFDFYVAIDDFNVEKQGAGMLGVVEFNSSTVYRYTDLNLHQFHSQISEKEEFIESIKLFIDAFIKSMPTGKINSFANQTIPQAVIINLREDRPLNLVSAFEEPIKSSNGYVKPSIEKLFEEHEKYSVVLEKPLFTNYLLLSENKDIAEIGKKEESVKSLIEDVAKKIEDYFEI